MPMIGGEAAEEAALARRHVQDGASADARDPYELGWVMDWLYGDSVLPPMPLLPEPQVVELPRWRRAMPARAHAAASAEPRGHRSRRHAPQLALL